MFTVAFAGSSSGTVKVVGVTSAWVNKKALAGFDTPTKANNTAAKLTIELCDLFNISSLNSI